MPDIYRGKSLDQLKDYWQLRASEAFLCYVHAVNQHRRIRDELDQGLVAVEDGSFVVLKARRTERMALNELVYVQRVYIDLLLGKTMPPADDDERPLI